MLDKTTEAVSANAFDQGAIVLEASRSYSPDVWSPPAGAIAELQGSVLVSVPDRITVSRGDAGSGWAKLSFVDGQTEVNCCYQGSGDGSDYVFDRCGGPGLVCAYANSASPYPPASVEGCEGYQGVADYLDCGEDSYGDCVFHADTGGGTCDDICNDRGEECYEAYESGSGSSASCELGEWIGCDAERSNQICVCGRLPIEGPSACTEGGCSAQSRLRASYVRLSVRSSDPAAGTTSGQALIPVLGTLGAPTCLGASGANCQVLQQDPAVPNRCGDGFLGAAPVQNWLTNRSSALSWSECVADAHYRPRGGGRQVQAVTVGSLLHDQCCIDNPEGLFCGGVPGAEQASARIYETLFPIDCSFFGDAEDHVSCNESDESCEFYVRSAGKTCSEVCSAHGQACVTGYDNTEHGEPSCDRGVEHGCNQPLVDQICVCEIGEDVDPTELCVTEMVRATRDATQDGRSWGITFEVGVPSAYSLLNESGSLTPESSFLAAPYGTDVREEDYARFCRSGEVDAHHDFGSEYEDVFPADRQLCAPYFEAPGAPTTPVDVSCETFGPDLDWVREGFSVTRFQSWVDTSLMDAAWPTFVPSEPGDPLLVSLAEGFRDTYNYTQRYLEAAIAQAPGTEDVHDCNTRRVIGLRDHRGEVVGVAVVRDLPSVQDGDNPRTRYAADMDVFFTRSDIYAPHLLDCVNDQLGQELLNVVRVRPVSRTAEFWEAQALRVESSRSAGTASTWAWDSGGNYYFEAACPFIDTAVSTLPLLGRGDETLVYDNGPDGIVQVMRRPSRNGVGLRQRQQMLSQISRWDYPTGDIEVAPNGVCATASRYLSNSLSDFADLPDDDELDEYPGGPSIPVIDPVYCGGVDSDDDGFEPGPAASGPTFSELLESFDGEEQCEALRSIARIRGAMKRPWFATEAERGSALWDFQAAIFPGGAIRIVDPRYVLVARKEGTPWELVDGIETAIPGRPGDADDLTSTMEQMNDDMDGWWETLGGDEAFEDCGVCRRLGDPGAPLDWAANGFEFTVGESYVDPILAETPPSGVFAPSPPDTTEYVQQYLDGIDVSSRTSRGNRGVAWVYAGEIDGVAHIGTDPLAPLPYAEIRLLGARSDESARRTAECALEMLEEGRLLVQLKASPAPSHDELWDIVTDEVDSARSAGTSTLFTDVEMDGRHVYEATCAAVEGGRVSDVVDAPLGTPGSQVHAYLLPDQPAYRDDYGPRVLQIPNTFGADFVEKLHLLAQAETLGWPTSDLEVYSRGLCATTSRYQANSSGIDDFDGYLEGLDGERRCTALGSVDRMRKALDAPSCIFDFQAGVYEDGVIALVDPAGVYVEGASQLESCQGVVGGHLEAWWESLGGDEAWGECECGAREPQPPSCEPGPDGSSYAYEDDGCVPEDCPPRHASSGGTCVPLGTNGDCASLGDACTGGKECRQLYGPGLPYACRCPAGTNLVDGECESNLADGSMVVECTDFGSDYVFCPAEGERPNRCVQLSAWTDCGACGNTCLGSKICDDTGVCVCPPDMPVLNPETGVCEAVTPEPECPPTYELNPASGQCEPLDDAECCGGAWRDPGQLGICCEDRWVAGASSCHQGGSPSQTCGDEHDCEPGEICRNDQCMRCAADDIYVCKHHFASTASFHEADEAGLVERYTVAWDETEPMCSYSSGGTWGVNFFIVLSNEIPAEQRLEMLEDMGPWCRRRYNHPPHRARKDDFCIQPAGSDAACQAYYADRVDGSEALCQDWISREWNACYTDSELVPWDDED